MVIVKNTLKNKSDLLGGVLRHSSLELVRNRVYVSINELLHSILNVLSRVVDRKCVAFTSLWHKDSSVLAVSLFHLLIEIFPLYLTTVQLLNTHIVGHCEQANSWLGIEFDAGVLYASWLVIQAANHFKHFQIRVLNCVYHGSEALLLQLNTLSFKDCCNIQLVKLLVNVIDTHLLIIVA